MSARFGTGRSASQAVTGGEGLELGELLVQIGRGRADNEAVDAQGVTSVKFGSQLLQDTPNRLAIGRVHYGPH